MRPCTKDHPIGSQEVPKTKLQWTSRTHMHFTISLRGAKGGTMVGLSNERLILSSVATTMRRLQSSKMSRYMANKRASSAFGSLGGLNDAVPA